MGRKRPAVWPADRDMPAFLLVGKVALLTGAARGIGRGTALRFARENASLILVDADDKAGNQVAQEISSSGGRARFLRADVSRAEDCARVVEGTLSEFNRIDILFNNAGIVSRATVPELSEQEWDRVMTVNVKSVFLMSRLVIPVMARNGGGSIINTASGWGLSGGRKAAAYCASKGAVVLLTKAMAIDHGPDNIRVNCICPGDTDTGMLAKEAQQLGETPDQFRADAARRPLGRIGRAEEIAEAALYLASDRSSFVTGTALVVDGGALAGSV